MVLFNIINLDILILHEMLEDYILVGTKKIGWEYTGLFTGKFDEEKYYIKANNSEMSNGDIVFSDKKPEGCNSEIRHHFTTHSI